MSLITPELVNKYAEAAKAANAAADEYKNLTADNDKRVADFVNTSEDEQIVKFREMRDKVQKQIEAAQAKMEEQAKAAREYAASQVSLTEGDPAEVKSRYLEARATATALRKAFALITDEETVNKIVEENGIQEVISLKGTATKGAATGIRRPRISAATVNGEPVANKDGKASFTELTKYVSSKFGKVTGDDLRNAAATAAGTDDLNSLADGTEVAFSFDIPAVAEGGTPTTIQVTITK